MKKIHDRAQKSGNKKIIGYVEILDEKMGQAGSHAGAWFEGLEKSFDDFRLKPEGLFKGFTSKDFDDLRHALFGTTPKKESHMNMSQRVAARYKEAAVFDIHQLSFNAAAEGIKAIETKNNAIMEKAAKLMARHKFQMDINRSWLGFKVWSSDGLYVEGQLYFKDVADKYRDRDEASKIFDAVLGVGWLTRSKGTWDEWVISFEK
jgi:hypothetical protein